MKWKKENVFWNIFITIDIQIIDIDIQKNQCTIWSFWSIWIENLISDDKITTIYIIFPLYIF